MDSSVKQDALIENYFQKADLLPVIVQEYETGEVLMLAYMNRNPCERLWRPAILVLEQVAAGTLE